MLFPSILPAGLVVLSISSSFFSSISHRLVYFLFNFIWTTTSRDTMLPNSPRAGRSLTTSRRAPSTQSRSISQSRYDGLSDYGGGTEDRYHRPGAVHQVRPQRSMGNLTSRPSNVNNMPPIPRLSKPPLSASASPTYSRGPFPRKSSESSASSSSSYVSASSSVPSFLDRMKQRYPGSSSSQTSLEIESDEPTGKGRPQYSQYSERRRGTIVGRERRNLSQQISRFCHSILVIHYVSWRPLSYSSRLKSTEFGRRLHVVWILYMGPGCYRCERLS